MKEELIYGRHPVLDAIRAGRELDKVILQRGTRGEFEKEVRALCKEHDIPLQYAPKERLQKWTKGNHQGIIALLAMIPYYRLEDLIPMLYEREDVPLIVILDGVTDVRNFGAIARTAECAGAHALVIPRKGAARINADAMKTSVGALAHLPVCREDSLNNAIDLLKMSGIQVFASDLKGEKILHELDFTVPTAIVLGSEDEGVSHSILNKSERFVIPQKGKTDSYNVSVAAGMMLYEVLRQRVG